MTRAAFCRDVVVRSQRSPKPADDTLLGAFRSLHLSSETAKRFLDSCP